MLKRTPLVYMVSPTALTCKHYVAGCTKTKAKILRPENSEKEKNAPDLGQKGRNRVRFGCWGGVQPVRTGGETGIDRHRTCLGCRLGRFAAERHWRSLTPRHALRRAQPCLVAESLCALTKNGEASIVLASLFLAGAEGLEPSARGFGVDVGTNHRERGKTGVTRFLPQVTKRAVLVWCCVEKPSCRER